MTWHSESNRKGREINLRKEMLGEIQEKGCTTIGKFGAVKTPDGIVFQAVLDKPEETSLLLYRRGTDEVVHEIPMADKHVMGNVYAVKVQNLDAKKYEYNYRVGKKVIQDSCAGVIRGRENFGELAANGDGHQIRCGFAFDTYNWKDDEPLRIPYEDAVMYCLHVRGFTMQPNSKVRHKGTFRGVAEKAEYLKNLGINQVKLMPAYEFDEIKKLHVGMSMNYIEAMENQTEKLNFWGYEKGWYFAPKASYAAGNDPVKEMKDMVSTLHQNGIEVLMEFYFTADVDFRMAADCLTWWITEYHIDGFHLLGNDELAKLLAKDPLFTGVKLLSTYFPTGEIYQEKKIPSYRNLAEFNAGFMEDARGLLKGDEKQLNAFTYRIRKNPDCNGVVNYMAAHDGFTLMDMVTYNDRHNEANGEQNHDGPDRNLSWNCGIEGPTKRKKIVELRNRQVRNAFLMLLLANGTPMIQAGDEFGNSQGGNNNPYCLDNETSWTDWKAARRNEELTAFVRDVLAFRKRHRILHMPQELKVMDTLSCGYPDLSYHGNRAWYGEFENGNREIGVMYCGQYAGEDNFIYVAYNLHWEEHEFALPNLPADMEWYEAIDSAVGVHPEGEEPAYIGKKTFGVPGRTIKVLIGRR